MTCHICCCSGSQREDDVVKEKVSICITCLTATDVRWHVLNHCRDETFRVMFHDVLCV